METLESGEIKQEREGDNDCQEIKLLMGCLVSRWWRINKLRMTEGALELSVVDVWYILVTASERSEATAQGKIQE